MTPAERHRDHAIEMREKFLAELALLPKEDATFVDELARASLEGVVRDLDASIAGVCPEDSKLLRGQPIGQYHCPVCGCMTLAGMVHVHDGSCWLGLG